MPVLTQCACNCAAPVLCSARAAPRKGRAASPPPTCARVEPPEVLGVADHAARLAYLIAALVLQGAEWGAETHGPMLSVASYWKLNQRRAGRPVRLAMAPLACMWACLLTCSPGSCVMPGVGGSWCSAGSSGQKRRSATRKREPLGV